MRLRCDVLSDNSCWCRYKEQEKAGRQEFRDESESEDDGRIDDDEEDAEARPPEQLVIDDDDVENEPDDPVQESVQKSGVGEESA